MVPDVLSSNLCSLRGGEKRLAFFCIWELDDDANIQNTRFHKSVIKSKAALTDQEAQLIMDDPSQTNRTAQSLRLLNTAKILKRHLCYKPHRHQMLFNPTTTPPLSQSYQSPIPSREAFRHSEPATILSSTTTSRDSSRVRSWTSMLMCFQC